MQYVRSGKNSRAAVVLLGLDDRVRVVVCPILTAACTVAFFCTQIPEDISLSDRKRSLFRMVVWPPLYLFALIYLFERRRRCPFGFRQISNVPSSFRESERKRVATLPWHTPLLCSLQLLKCEQYVSKCSVMRLCPIRQSLAAQDDLARI